MIVEREVLRCGSKPVVATAPALPEPVRVQLAAQPTDEARFQSMKIAEYLIASGKAPETLTPEDVVAPILPEPATTVPEPRLLVACLATALESIGIDLSFTKGESADLIKERYKMSASTEAGMGVLSWGSLHTLATFDSAPKAARFVWRLEGDYDTIPEGSLERAQFVTRFEYEIAQTLGVSPHEVCVRKVSAGSRILEFVLIGGAFLRADDLAARVDAQNFASGRILDPDQAKRFEFVPLFERLQLSPAELNPSFNRDFRIPAMCPRGERRGGEPYNPPVDWFRYGLNVAHHIAAAGAAWIGMSNSPGEWAVAYHGIRGTRGTPDVIAPVIVRQGLAPGLNNAYGHGVYCTPQPAIARGYTAPVPVTGREVGTGAQVTTHYRIAFMCRVNLPAGRVTRHAVADAGGGEYWVVRDAQDIRPYGLLVQRQ